MELFEKQKGENGRPVDLSAPLAERMRPRSLAEFIGHDTLIRPGKALHHVIENGLTTSLIFWGPPGSGKTTLARIIADSSENPFVEYSAVLSGIKQIKEVLKQAEFHRKAYKKPTILFIDEIHRFNKAQQDAFLPHVENGTILLMGATTENPSFEVIPALLSRTRVFTLEALSIDDIMEILRRAIDTPGRGLAHLKPDIPEETLKILAEMSGGDARVALNGLEFAVQIAPVQEDGTRRITGELLVESLQKRSVYDKSGESHFNLISAFHKSLRGSDPDAALYWLARMLDGGENPLYIARRMVRFASEDIGLADPSALSIAVAAKDAYHFLGSPEGILALAECAVYLATAPKSNAIYKAMRKAEECAGNSNCAAVPLHLRNAPTALMKKLGYGKGYRYDHDDPDHYAGQQFFPDEIGEQRFYTPGRMGFEKTISERLNWWKRRKRS